MEGSGELTLVNEMHHKQLLNLGSGALFMFSLVLLVPNIL